MNTIPYFPPKSQAQSSKEVIELAKRIIELGVSPTDANAVIHMERFRRKVKIILAFPNVSKEKKIEAIQTAIRQFLVLEVDEEPEPQIDFNRLPERNRALIARLENLGISLLKIASVIESKIFVLTAEKILEYCKDSRITQATEIRVLIDRLPELEKLAKGKESKPRKRKVSECGYITLKRLGILAAVVENAAMDSETIAIYAKVSQRRVLDALHKFEKEGKIVHEKLGRKKVWKATAEGVASLTAESMTFLRCDIQEISSKSHNKNVILAKTYGISIEIAQAVSKELKDMGWYPTCIRQALKNNSVGYLFSMIRKIKNNTDIQNPGGYLMAIIRDAVPDRKRITAFCSKVLKNLSQDVKETFTWIAENEELTPQQYQYLAYSLRTADTKGQSLNAGDVHGILGWIRKRERGIIMRS